MTREVSLVPGKRAFVVGVGGVMARYDMGEHAAKKLLRSWWAEQQEGGPVRVFARLRGGHRSYFTTEAVLMRDMPPARDTRLVRKVDGLERDLDFQARRCDQLKAALDALATRVRSIEQQRSSGPSSRR